MSARHLLLLFTAALAIEGPARAEPLSNVRDVNKMTAADLNIRSKYKMTPYEISSICGVYSLSDGRKLKVHFEKQRLFADLGERSFEIVATSKSTLESIGGENKFQFDQEAVGPSVRVSEK